MTLPVDPARYLVYLGVMSAMAAFPGPANLFATAVGMTRGHKAALLGVFGMNLASLVWYGFAALGLGALVAAFPGVFRGLRLVGAGYLLWLAYGAVRSGPKLEAARGGRSRSALVDGFTVQVTNPKTLLFFTVVLPPFLDLARPLVPQLLLFAAASFVMDVVAMSAYGLGGAALSARMSEPRFRAWFGLATAILLVGAAVMVALPELNG